MYITALDCYDVGVEANGSKDYYHVILWMLEALDRLRAEEKHTVSEASILDYLAFAAYNVMMVLITPT